MRRPLGLACTAVLLLHACGEPRSSAKAELVVPWPASLQCGNLENLVGMTATVLVSGDYPPCELTVGDDLGASGVCPDVRTDIVRYLLLTYAKPSSGGGAPAPLAYVVGMVDLRPEALEPDTQYVTAEVGNAPGDFVVTPAQLAALPDEASLSASSSHEERARAWSKSEIVASSPVSLDEDDDGCANLQETCAGTLFVDGDTSCPN